MKGKYSKNAVNTVENRMERILGGGSHLDFQRAVENTRLCSVLDPFCFRNTRCVSVVGHRQTSVKLARDNRAWCVPYFGGGTASSRSRV